MEREIFESIQELVYRHSGIHLSEKEAGVLETRVTMRAKDVGIPTLEEYAHFLRTDRGNSEIPALLDAITINYTFFFRENKHFQTLRAEVFPNLLRAKRESGNDRIRVWSAGCSTGEEPYSIAVSFAETVGEVESHDFKILASDINRKVLRVAKKGVYPRARLSLFPQEHFYKYLVKDHETPDGCLRMGQEIRAMVMFRRFNILDETKTFRRQFDLIFCRNVMIYFDEPSKRRLTKNFHRYLVPGGYLFIGESESLVDPERRFRQVGGSLYRTV